jgi:hypothetical protein
MKHIGNLDIVDELSLPAQQGYVFNPAGAFPSFAKRCVNGHNVPFNHQYPDSVESLEAEEGATKGGSIVRLSSFHAALPCHHPQPP